MEAGGLAATTGLDPNIDAKLCFALAAAALEAPFPRLSLLVFVFSTRLLTCAFSVVKTTSNAWVGMTRGVFATYWSKYSFRLSANWETTGSSWISTDFFGSWK